MNLHTKPNDVSTAVVSPPSPAELESIFRMRHGAEDTWGWSPRQRFQRRYFVPAEHYEAIIRRLVTAETQWLDVGGGWSLFPHNPTLATELAARCQRLVAVDPSDNVFENPYAHHKAKCLLEQFETDETFNLATMRMVVEHVSDPAGFVGALRRLLRPGGLAIAWTVNSWSPISIVSRFTPFFLHEHIKRLFWWETKKEDTFPVQYKMNTHRQLNHYFVNAGFEELMFLKLDDLSATSNFRWANYIDLQAWQTLHRSGLHYPENCLLGVYRRRND